MCVSSDRSKDGCASLPFVGDIISALSLWYKRAPKSSYKKCRFAAFLRCLRTTAVLTKAKLHLSTTLLPYMSHVSKCTSLTATCSHGPGNETAYTYLYTILKLKKNTHKAKVSSEIQALPKKGKTFQLSCACLHNQNYHHLFATN